MLLSAHIYSLLAPVGAPGFLAVMEGICSLLVPAHDVEADRHTPELITDTPTLILGWLLGTWDSRVLQKHV